MRECKSPYLQRIHLPDHAKILSKKAIGASADRNHPRLHPVEWPSPGRGGHEGFFRLVPPTMHRMVLTLAREFGSTSQAIWNWVRQADRNETIQKLQLRHQIFLSLYLSHGDGRSVGSRLACHAPSSRLDHISQARRGRSGLHLPASTMTIQRRGRG
jgi:hypothetical protein